jgi:endoglycosylceramidase
MSDADKRAQTSGDALMLSEFGATDDLATIRSNIRLADRHMVSWQYWHYCECQDPTTTGTGTQSIVVDPAQPPSGSNVKQAKLDVLAEPYPQVVAGTPTSFGFDDTTRTFSLAYSTKGPTGKNFARRAKHRRKRRKTKFRQTQIFLPPDHYPAGYSVTVQGGGIASKPKASVLRVVACPGKANVSVTVTPRAGNRNRTDCRVTPKRKKRRR